MASFSFRTVALLLGASALVASASSSGCSVSLSDGTGGSGDFDDGPSTKASGGYGTTGHAATGSGAGYDPPATAPPPISPPEEETPATCAELDPTTPAALYLSADDSNSMASPALARELLGHGLRPQSIRTYEFLNYYHVDYPAPEANGVGIFLDGAPGAAPGETDLQIGVRAPNAGARRPMTLTLVLDTSGSMDGEPIERERAAVFALAAELAEGDVVNVLTWSNSSNVVLDGHVASGPNDPVLVQIAETLATNGGTDLHSGLVNGYALATKSYDPARLNRLVMVSDGGANIGVTDAELIGAKSALGEDEGIYLIGVGAGPGSNYSDALMDTVTDAGRGAYVYLDAPGEAARIFGDRFAETTEIAARAVQVKLELPWYMQMQKFYGEEYSTDPHEVKPQHLAPDDAMVFAQVIKACDPSVVNPTDPVTVTVTWETPVSHLPMSKTVTTTVGAIAGGDAKRLAKGNAVVAYAEALKTFTQADLGAAKQKVALAKALGPDAELDEIDGLLDAALSIAN